MAGSVAQKFHPGEQSDGTGPEKPRMNQATRLHLPPVFSRIALYFGIPAGIIIGLALLEAPRPVTNFVRAHLEDRRALPPF